MKRILFLGWALAPDEKLGLARALGAYDTPPERPKPGSGFNRYTGFMEYAPDEDCPQEGYDRYLFVEDPSVLLGDHEQSLQVRLAALESVIVFGRETILNPVYEARLYPGAQRLVLGATPPRRERSDRVRYLPQTSPAQLLEAAGGETRVAREAKLALGRFVAGFENHLVVVDDMLGALWDNDRLVERCREVSRAAEVDHRVEAVRQEALRELPFSGRTPALLKQVRDLPNPFLLHRVVVSCCDENSAGPQLEERLRWLHLLEEGRRVALLMDVSWSPGGQAPDCCGERAGRELVERHGNLGVAFTTIMRAAPPSPDQGHPGRVTSINLPMSEQDALKLGTWAQRVLSPPRPKPVPRIEQTLSIQIGGHRLEVDRETGRFRIDDDQRGASPGGVLCGILVSMVLAYQEFVNKGRTGDAFYRMVVECKRFQANINRNTLRTCIKRLRNALGDSDRGQGDGEYLGCGVDQYSRVRRIRVPGERESCFILFSDQDRLPWSEAPT